MSIGAHEIGAAGIGAPLADGVDVVHIQESVTITPAIADEMVNGLVEALTLTGSWAVTAQVEEQLAESAQLADAIQLVFKAFCTDSTTITVTDSVYATTVAQAVEELTLTGLAVGPIQAIYQIAAGLTINDLLEIRYDMVASETINVSASISELFYAHVAAVESALISSSAVPALVAMVTATEGVTLTDSLLSTLQAQEHLQEGIEIVVQVTLDDGIYWAYVLNTESKAASNYVNFPYNSFAKINGKYYGAREAGIYLLEGDDDAGTQIDAHIRSGLRDFNTTYLKRLKYAYLGYTTDGKVLLKIIDTADGTKTERHYELVEQTADTYREARRKLGGGVKSRYWGFELANIDGADFDLESIQFMPIMLTRRLNSG